MKIQTYDTDRTIYSQVLNTKSHLLLDFLKTILSLSSWW